MAWVTRIVDMEQVEYRLTQHSGCYVQLDGEGAAPASQQPGDAQVDYRMDAAEDSGLVWIGEGPTVLGLTSGAVLDEDGKEAARALANGVDPRTGERLVEAELRAHPRAQLVGARLVEAIEKAAEAAGVEAAALFANKPKQAAKYATLARNANLLHRRTRPSAPTGSPPGAGCGPRRSWPPSPTSPPRCSGCPGHRRRPGWCCRTPPSGRSPWS
ncbi:hypothetical protein GCM10010207_51990 [Streptomyces atratus]|nr:hypothetical protein GCM10010207_51990 [Streptomyces atratus]